MATAQIKAVNVINFLISNIFMADRISWMWFLVTANGADGNRIGDTARAGELETIAGNGSRTEEGFGDDHNRLQVRPGRIIGAAFCRNRAGIRLDELPVGIQNSKLLHKCAAAQAMRIRQHRRAKFDDGQSSNTISCVW